MNSVVTRYQAALVHFAWVLASVAVSAVLAYLSSPGVFDFLGTQAAVVAAGVLVPVVSALLKYLRTQAGTTVTIAPDHTKPAPPVNPTGPAS